MSDIDNADAEQAEIQMPGAACLVGDVLTQTQVLRARLLALIATHLGPDVPAGQPEPCIKARMSRMALALETAESARAHSLEQAGRYDDAQLAQESAEECRVFLASLGSVD